MYPIFATIHIGKYEGKNRRKDFTTCPTHLKDPTYQRRPKKGKRRLKTRIIQPNSSAIGVTQWQACPVNIRQGQDPIEASTVKEQARHSEDPRIRKKREPNPPRGTANQAELRQGREKPQNRGIPEHNHQEGNTQSRSDAPRQQGEQAPNQPKRS